jgi:hypothetical protein
VHPHVGQMFAFIFFPFISCFLTRNLTKVPLSSTSDCRLRSTCTVRPSRAPLAGRPRSLHCATPLANRDAHHHNIPRNWLASHVARRCARPPSRQRTSPSHHGGPTSPPGWPRNSPACCVSCPTAELACVVCRVGVRQRQGDVGRV